MKMRGTSTFMAPRDNNKYKDYDNTNGNMINILPQNIGLNGVNDFIQIKQTEEWNLKPMESGKLNELEGTIKIRREPVNIDDKCDSFEIEYQCILKLASNPEQYY